MRHPSEKFIKYLMTPPHPSAHNDDWVIHTMVSLGYPAPEGPYLSWLRQSFAQRIPKDFQPQNKYHRASVAFMRQEGIYALHHADTATRAANQIVMNLRARPIIEQLLLGRMEPKDVARRTNARLGEFFTTEAVEAYFIYYWNVSLLTVEDWNELYKSYEVQRDNVLAIVQCGPAMALHKTGFQQNLESKTMLKEILESLYFDLREWKTKPLSINRTRALTNIAKAAVMVDGRLSESDSALKDSLKQFEDFRMKHAQSQVASMRDIAPSGNYSGSGAKLLDGKPEKQPEEAVE